MLLSSRVFRHVNMSILLASLAACAQSSPADSPVNDSLRSAFESLYLVQFAKNFPEDQDRLVACRQSSDEPCLSAYQTVIIAKDKIKQMPRQQALSDTLDIISKSCASDDEIEANYVCYGGLISLSLYDNKSEDLLILKTIKTMSPRVQSLIFNSDFSWFGNRANVDEWTVYISSANIDWEYERSKEVTLQSFTPDDPYATPYWAK